MSASQSRAAASTSVSSTARRSKVERLMTLSTSAVAVCCWSDPQLVEQPRVFDGDDRLTGEVLDQRNLLVTEWVHFLAVDDDGAEELSLFEHRH